jgi:nucleoside-diphosphate-sugar epimerase
VKKCTVFGGNGYIGRNLVNLLTTLGYKVIVPTRDELPSRRDSLGHVFYCIGLTADFRQRPFDTVHAHVTKLSNVLENSRFESLLYLSSTRIYQLSTSTHEESNIVVNPHIAGDLYNISKLMGESLCLSSGIDGVRVARLSNVVGRYEGEVNSFLPSICNEAKAGRIVLRSDRLSCKDYIYVDDATDLLVKIGLGGISKAYNVASGSNISHGQIVDRLVDRYGCGVEVISGAEIITFPEINVKRIRKEFGFTPKSVLEMIGINDDTC